VREGLKRVAFIAASIAALPALVSYGIRRALLGPDRALEGSTQGLSLIPGMPGDYLRRAFLARVLAGFDRTATVQFGTIFSQAGAHIGAHAYVGPRCHLGLVDIGRDVLIGAGVHIPSGADTHGSADLDRPIREQGGTRRMVHIGEGTWIGSAAVVMADIGRHCIVGAGAVVTKALPDGVVAVGVPARVVRFRDAGVSSMPQAIRS
jgi:acetyltransferase-like isoleucine patch superfamily enzyme